MTSKNPDIADLNDDNRPTKLAEKFGQLYDDAWTDSMEELTGVETRLNDREAISFLLRIVMVLFTFLPLTSLVHSFISTYIVLYDYTCTTITIIIIFINIVYMITFQSFYQAPFLS